MNALLSSLYYTYPWKAFLSFSLQSLPSSFLLSSLPLPLSPSFFVFERHSTWELERFAIYWFTSQMPITARVGGQADGQEPGIPNWFSHMGDRDPPPRPKSPSKTGPRKLVWKWIILDLSSSGAAPSLRCLSVVICR